MTQQSRPQATESQRAGSRHARLRAGSSRNGTGTNSRIDLDTDRMLELALTRLVELVGEAAWFVP